MKIPLLQKIWIEKGITDTGGHELPGSAMGVGTPRFTDSIPEMLSWLQGGRGGAQGWQQGWAAGIAAISKAGSSPGSALCLAGGERHLQKPLLQRKSFFRSLERFAKVNE